MESIWNQLHQSDTSQTPVKHQSNRWLDQREDSNHSNPIKSQSFRMNQAAIDLLDGFRSC